MISKRVGIAVALVGVVVLATVASAAITAQPVLTGAADQYEPSSNGTYLAWSQSVRRRGHAYVRTIGSTGGIRVNAPRTYGFLGSFVQGTDRIVYQQIARGDSDIFVFDVSSRARGQIGGVSTSEWELSPVASSRWILFERQIIGGRGFIVRQDLLLQDRVSGSIRTLIRDIPDSRLVFPGYAGQDYVAWTTCGGGRCDAYYHNVSTRATRRVPFPAGMVQYAPFIDEANSLIYYVRSAPRCGRLVSIRKAPLGATSGSDSTLIASLAPGIDTDWVMSLAPNLSTGQQDLYFGRWSCARQETDIYVLRSANTVARTTVPASPEDLIGKIGTGPKPPPPGGSARTPVG
jgi:hypothetical protein